jgi:internalin A
MAKYARTVLALLFVLTLVAAWVAVRAAPVPNRAEVTPELPPEVATEWSRAAQATRWLYADTYGTTEHGNIIEWYHEPVPAGAMPAFYFEDLSRTPICNSWILPRTVPVDFSTLPKPERPFGLLFDSTYPPSEGDRLHQFENLHTIHAGLDQMPGLSWLAPLGQLRSLSLGGRMNDFDTELRHLAGLKSLHALKLWYSNTTDAGLKHVAALRELQWLDLQKTQITDAGLKHLAGLPNLMRLRLADTKIGDAGLAHVARHADLTHLDLSGTGVTDAGLKHLAACRELVELNLSDTRVTADGLKALACLPRLRKLNLSQNFGLEREAEPERHGLSATGATDRELEVLAACTELRELTLTGAQVTDAGLKHLAGLKKLATLDLIACRELTGAGLRPLVALTALNLSCTPLGDTGLEYLAGLKRLTRLNLSSTRVRGPGLKHLVGLHNLADLDLSYNYLQNDSGELIARLPQLRRLDLCRTGEFDGGDSARGNSWLQHLATYARIYFAGELAAARGDGWLKHLAKCPRLDSLRLPTASDKGLRHMTSAPALKHLVIEGTDTVTAEGVRALAASKSLTQLMLTRSRMSADELEVLRKQYPRLTIYQTDFLPSIPSRSK